MSTLLGDILPLGSLWERHGQPRQRCARKEDESPKPPNLRRGIRVNAFKFPRLLLLLRFRLGSGPLEHL